MIHETGPLNIKGDLGKRHAVMLAGMACFGFVTTLDPMGGPTKFWRLTPEGLTLLLEEHA